MFDGKSILVTGGTGSFGKKCIKHLLTHHKPRRVIVFSRDELKQFEMSSSAEFCDQEALRFFIGDVRDRERLMQAFSGVDIVIHAAALKQVPACEYNPLEAVKTNVLGAGNIIDAAVERGVSRVLALSTDKACNPVNLYGATKLCSDKLFVAASAYAGKRETKFAVVRYGNVVGSRGSVVPLFLKQRDQGILTITDDAMTRFWITLDQGVHFVLTSLERMDGGEIFVPKIPSMRVIDLAKAIAPNAEHRVTGIRSGEKLHEIMISADDARQTLEFDDRYAIYQRLPERSSGKAVAKGFEYVSNSNTEWLDRAALMQMIEGVLPQI